MASWDRLACEALEESADTLERRIGVVGWIDGEELDDYIVFEFSGSGVTDAVRKGSSSLVWSLAMSNGTFGEVDLRQWQSGYQAW